MKRMFAQPKAAPCTGDYGPPTRMGSGTPQILIVVVVFAWALAAVRLGVPEGTLIGLLTAAGTVSAHLIGRDVPRSAAAAL